MLIQLIRIKHVYLCLQPLTLGQGGLLADHLLSCLDEFGTQQDVRFDFTGTGKPLAMKTGAKLRGSDLWRPLRSNLNDD